VQAEEEEEEEEEEKPCVTPTEFLDHIARSERWMEADLANRAEGASLHDEQMVGLYGAEIEATELWQRCWDDTKFDVVCFQMRYHSWMAAMVRAVAAREPQTVHLTAVCVGTPS
jgi:hypothetical protein